MIKLRETRIILPDNIFVVSCADTLSGRRFPGNSHISINRGVVVQCTLLLKIEVT